MLCLGTLFGRSKTAILSQPIKIMLDSITAFNIFSVGLSQIIILFFLFTKVTYFFAKLRFVFSLSF